MGFNLREELARSFEQMGISPMMRRLIQFADHRPTRHCVDEIYALRAQALV